MTEFTASSNADLILDLWKKSTGDKSKFGWFGLGFNPATRIGSINRPKRIRSSHPRNRGEHRSGWKKPEHLRLPEARQQTNGHDGWPASSQRRDYRTHQPPPIPRQVTSVRYKLLGNSELRRLSELCLGTMTFGDPIQPETNKTI